MAAATKPQGSGLITIASKDLFNGPPGVMGFENLITPDVYSQPGQAESINFKVQVHYNPAQEAILVTRLQAVADKLFTQWLKLAEAAEQAAKENGKKFIIPAGGFVKPDAAQWVANHMMPCSERSKTQLPYMQFKNAAEYKDKKTQEMVRKVMRAYDRGDNLLDLKALKMGMGSVIQPILMGGLYKSPLIPQPDFSLKLQGVRVLQLVQFGGGGSRPNEVNEDDLSSLGEGFEAADLGAYAKKADEVAPKAPTAADPDGFEDEELPF